jgi:uncharacterized protein (TIRG00374 family)
LKKLFMEDKEDNRNVEKQKGRRLLFRRGFLLLRLTGIIIFIVILTRVDLNALWQQLRTADPLLFALGAAFQVLLLILKAYRWYLLNPDARQQGNIRQSFGEFFESYAIGVVTPGRMGEVMKAGYARQRSGVVGAGLRVIAERGLDLGFFLLVAGASVAFASLVGINVFWGWLVIIAGTASIMVAVGILLSRKMLGVINSALVKLRIVAEPLGFIRQRKVDNLLIFLLSLASNLSAFLSAFFLGLAVAMNASFLYLSGGVAIAGLINLLPVTVMGLGTRELTFLYVFNEFVRPQVLAFSGLIFLVAQVGGGIISLIAGELFLLSLKKKKGKD